MALGSYQIRRFRPRAASPGSGVSCGGRSRNTRTASPCADHGCGWFIRRALTSSNSYLRVLPALRRCRRPDGTATVRYVPSVTDSRLHYSGAANVDPTGVGSGASCRRGRGYRSARGVGR